MFSVCAVSYSQTNTPQLLHINKILISRKLLVVYINLKIAVPNKE